MSYFVVSGGRRLEGTVEVGGSKNASLALLSAVCLCDGTTVLTNVPQISDTNTKANLLERFGAKVSWNGNRLAIDCSHLFEGDADEETVRSIRTSFFLLGPLLARLGKVKIAAPGGCKIGARPVDYHLKGLRALGANIDFEGGVYYASVDKFKGAEIYLDFPSAGATQHIMTAAVLAEGNTVIQNAAMEPEILTLASFLNGMGANIEGAGTSTITISGRKSVKETEFRVPADRMQAGTYMMAAAMTQGDITVAGLLPDDQTAVVNKLREAGAEVFESNDSVRVRSNDRLRGIRVKTMPFPGFPTDMQQPMCSVLTLADGESVIEETIYEARIGHVDELNRMGANIKLAGKATIIQGTEKLRSANVVASDLRAGASLVLAGLAAEGDTIIRNIHLIDRGYENLEETFTALGGKIERVAAPEGDLAP